MDKIETGVFERKYVTVPTDGKIADIERYVHTSFAPNAQPLRVTHQLVVLLWPAANIVDGCCHFWGHVYVLHTSSLMPVRDVVHEVFERRRHAGRGQVAGVVLAAQRLSVVVGVAD